jgi:taurine dioxygenase
MRFERLSPHIGAEVSGLDLSGRIDKAALRQGLADHQLLVIRDQPINARQQLQLAEVFGEPIKDPHPKFGCVNGQEEVSLVINDAANPPDINVWHTDTTFLDPPAGTCVLHCVEMPKLGGNTIWASMFAAYDALSTAMKAFLEPLDAYHQLPLDGFPPDLIATVSGRPIAATHPVIRWVREAGRAALFVNRVYTQRIEGLTKAESKGVLEALFAITENADRHYRFAWQPGSTVIWDNRSTQHFAVADYFPERRVMHRIAVRGEPVIAYRDRGKQHAR